jgi:hypothetical protein|tara:strand:+ start:159 stop:758 length:600 start_codon:yes stop_codon:yes gene_type:complete
MNELAIIENGALTDINKALKNITRQHKKVSGIATPKAFIKQKMGMDYVEYSVMRDIADKEYPGWSWTVIKTEFAGTEAYVIHGRLKWFDNGVWREGDATAAHRVQKKRGTNDYVDLGNDIKAANTDCIKKAFNMYMNICDDVYRNQVEDPELTDEQKNNIFESAKISGRDTEVMEKVKSGVINAFNYKASMAKLERLAQ